MRGASQGGNDKTFSRGANPAAIAQRRNDDGQYPQTPEITAGQAKSDGQAVILMACGNRA